MVIKPQPLVKAALVAATCFTLIACSDDKDKSASSPDTGAPAARSMIAGTAAIGAPIVNAAVDVKCGDKTFSVNTNSIGEFDITNLALAAAGAQLPCALKVASPLGDLFSVALEQGITNITPLTHLALERALAGETAAWFADQSKVTDLQSKLEDAANKLAEELKKADAEGKELAFDIFNSAFKADGITEYDFLLDQLQEALANASQTYADLVSTFAGGNGFPEEIKLGLDLLPALPLPPEIPLPIGTQTLKIEGSIVVMGKTVNLRNLPGIPNVKAPTDGNQFCLNDAATYLDQFSLGLISVETCAYADNKATVKASVGSGMLKSTYDFKYTWSEA